MIKDRESFEHVVKYILAKNFRLDESEIKNTDRFVDDLGADSIDEVEVIVDFEVLYNLKFSVDDRKGSEKWTVQDFIDLIERKIEERDNPKNK